MKKRKTSSLSKDLSKQAGSAIKASTQLPSGCGGSLEMVTVPECRADMLRVLADIQRGDRKGEKEKLCFVRTQKSGQICN